MDHLYRITRSKRPVFVPLTAAGYNAQGSGQSKRDQLFGGRKDIESGETGERSAEAKLDKADEYQDKTEDAYKVQGVLPCVFYALYSSLAFPWRVFLCFCPSPPVGRRLLLTFTPAKICPQETAWCFSYL